MSRNSSNLLTLLLSVAGAGLAGWLTVEHYLPDTSLPCGPEGGCQSVLHSAYSQLGPVPISILGLLMYLALAALCVRRRRLHGSSERAKPTGSPGGGGTDPAGVSPGGVRPTDFAESDDSDLPELSDSDSPDGESLRPDLASQESVPRELMQADGALWLLALAGALISWGLQYAALFVIQSFCPYCFTSALLITGIFLLASRDYLLKAQPLTETQRLIAGWGGLILIVVGFTVYSRYETQNSLHQADMSVAVKRRMDNPVMDMTGLARDRLMRSDSYVLGDPKAPYHLVEFGDYQCPSCKAGSSLADQLVMASHGKVNLMFRNLPLRVHPWSTDAALAAEAAGKLGKFWPMHDLLYQNQDVMESSSFTTKRFSDWAVQIGLDRKAFEAAAQSPALAAKVRRDVDDANASHALVTPTFYLITPGKIWEINRSSALKSALADPEHAGPV